MHTDTYILSYSKSQCTGGGGDLNFIASEHTASCPCNLSDGLIANGKEEMIQAVRKEIKYGSDWIKLLVTGVLP
jgi:hypothetical protein